MKECRFGLFVEWLEFSPFEFGLANYGVFGKTRDFGGKFYKGRLVKKFDEVPLSYLQGKHFIHKSFFFLRKYVRPIL